MGSTLNCQAAACVRLCSSSQVNAKFEVSVTLCSLVENDSWSIVIGAAKSSIVTWACLSLRDTRPRNSILLPRSTGKNPA